MRFLLSLVLALSLATTSACTRRKEVWIYTSLPKEVISPMVEPLQAAVPEADVKWYQSGSDNVATRLNSEIDSGKVKADLVVTSDPLWYLEMKQKGRLLAYDSPAAREVPAEFRDPDNAFVAMRVPVMVLAYSTHHLKTELPTSWKELASPRFDRKLSLGNPLESPHAFVVLALLSKLEGWEFFAELRKLGLVAEGTHSSVVTRIETGERPLGILPLETVLRLGARNTTLKPIYPQDGVIPVPGPIAILKDTDHPEIARKVYDWFFSPAAQAIVVHSGSYSPMPKAPTPEGARPWIEIQPQMMKWSPETLTTLLQGRDRIRAKFSEVVLH